MRRLRVGCCWCSACCAAGDRLRVVCSCLCAALAPRYGGVCTTQLAGPCLLLLLLLRAAGLTASESFLSDLMQGRIILLLLLAPCVTFMATAACRHT